MGESLQLPNLNRPPPPNPSNPRPQPQPQQVPEVSFSARMVETRVRRLHARDAMMMRRQHDAETAAAAALRDRRARFHTPASVSPRLQTEP